MLLPVGLDKVYSSRHDPSRQNKTIIIFQILQMEEADRSIMFHVRDLI